MNAVAHPAAERMEVLRGILSSATHDASAAMSRWTAGLVTLTLEDVEELSLQEALEQSGMADRIMTMVVLCWQAPWAGTLILAFDENGGRRLADSLLGRATSSEEGLSGLAQSALMETGNILGCAYLNALNRAVEVELVPSPPYFMQDYATCVLQQALMEPAAESDRVLLAKTLFHHQKNDLDWCVLFIPGKELRQALERAVLTDI
jgi:chemotaxis protein CheC